ncbi:probable serine/threonine-protein kinase DDB_G0267686 [Stylophora pistillata]|uniref:probable serine/threonine-protein kinase DDB_G0267686 n=1 Tax=Stylophora pistillata TaxID=50429 RepID=UPI000C039BB8|nr:probable serine/threonine-protein kinase DDB_G0267686 [Stylophora pistillata]
MKWSEEHDLMLCREVLLLEPFKHPRQSKERGKIWGEIALSLNGISSPNFKVSKRSVRDRLTLLLAKYKEKMTKEEQGSGIACDDETEIEIALSEIIEKEQAADLERKENSNTLTKKNENDKASAEESRLKAMERLGQTRKRNADTSCDDVSQRKSRSSITEAVQILKEKIENEREIRKEEIELKKKEQENKAAQHQMLIDQQRQNQQQYQDVLRIMAEQQHRQEQQQQNFQMLFLQQQQQQQQSQMLMDLLEKVVPKSS